jgi:hypothetical protein
MIEQRAITNGPSVNALLGEHVTAVFAEYPAVAEQLRAVAARTFNKSLVDRARVGSHAVSSGGRWFRLADAG